jgi:ribosomal peptide maturation radical SAM protein 1
MACVLLINMPFSNLRWPNIGPSLLKAALIRRGIGCDIAYLNFDFAERIGAEYYTWLADQFAFVLGGERLFAKHYFDNLPDDDSYYREVLLAADAEMSERDRCDFQSTDRHIEPFLDQAMSAIEWSRYSIVGFAASFQQTMPSMCLARRIKQLWPEMTIVFGGAACEGEMGVELLQRFPEIDYVFLGEADLTFPAVVEQIFAGEPIRLPPGVIRRDAAPSPCGDPAASCTADPSRFMVRDMDALPTADFDDYFARLERSPLKREIEPLLFFETSRGCWWGEKHHCAFCGLNGSTMTYRSKSPTRAVEELKYLVARHGIRRACSADNILDHRYFRTFLPMLKEAGLGLGFVFEMKTNLTREQVELLLDAGLGAAQLGIETFITPVLKRINKGANAVQNLQTLKWFSEAGVEVKWNVLWGFPGEDPRGYAEMINLIPSLHHLAPPLAVGRVRMDRFSPYFEDPAAHGAVNPRPNRAFRFVYPFPPDSLSRLAYYFEYDYADGRDPLQYAAPLLEAVAHWQSLKGTVTLRQWDRGDGVLLLTDTRPAATQFQRRLSGLQRAIYLHCDTGRTLENILRFASQVEPGIDDGRIRRILDGWINDRIMARVDERYLNLALYVKSSETLPSGRPGMVSSTR